MTEGLLDGVRILDMSMHLSGPYGSMLLADLGAEVIKVEPPTGDPQRLLNPRIAGVPVMFASLNRNKKSIVLDLRADRGRELFLALVEHSDIVYNNYRPDVLTKLGLDADVLRSANPRVIVASLSGYGTTGPRRHLPAYDTAIQALSGSMAVTGHPGGPPTRAGIPIADLAGGLFLALAVTSALHRRDVSGQAVDLDLSLFDSSISLLMYWAGLALNTDVTPGPQGSGNTLVYPYGAFPTSDGWIIIAPYSGAFWPKVCIAIARPDIIDDPRFHDNSTRVAHRAELEELLNAEFRKRSSAEWLRILDEADVPAGPVNSVFDAMHDPQIDARAMRLPVEIEGEQFHFAGNPIKTSPPTPDVAAPPPRLGQHSRELLSTLLSISDAEIAELSRTAVTRVEDLAGPTWVGPAAGRPGE